MRLSASRGALWSLVILASFTNLFGKIHAGDQCCDQCGNMVHCHKICRLICETKKVTTVCWGCKTEDFCVPGPSTLCAKHCEIVCDEDDPKAPCTQPKKFPWTEWIPNNNGKIYTKTKLMKRTITKTVPSYKWVVEEVCEQCEAQLPLVKVPAGVDVPAPPVTDAKVQPVK